MRWKILIEFTCFDELLLLNNDYFLIAVVEVSPLPFL